MPSRAAIDAIGSPYAATMLDSLPPMQVIILALIYIPKLILKLILKPILNSYQFSPSYFKSYHTLHYIGKLNCSLIKSTL